MKTIQALTAALCLALMATGCAVTEMRSVTKTPDSGFLGKDASLLTPGDISKGQVGLRYFNPSAQWRQYTKIIIEPVTFWGDDTTKVKPPDQQALATYFRGALEKEFAQQFEIITTPAPDVVRLQVAITDAEAATPGMRTISVIVPQMRLLNAVQSMATDKQVFAGGLQAEMKLTDAATGQLLSAAVGRAMGGGSIKAAAQVEWGDAQNAMDFFAKRAATNFKALTTGRATVAELPVE